MQVVEKIVEAEKENTLHNYRNAEALPKGESVGGHSAALGMEEKPKENIRHIEADVEDQHLFDMALYFEALEAVSSFEFSEKSVVDHHHGHHKVNNPPHHIHHHKIVQMAVEPDQGYDSQNNIEQAPPAQNGDVFAQDSPVPVVEIFDFVNRLVEMEFRRNFRQEIPEVVRL